MHINMMRGGKKPIGRPRRKRKDSVRELLEKVGANWEQTFDREQWKEIVFVAK